MKELNIPNALTVLRLIIGPIVFVLILLSKNYFALALFVVAALSDLLDGYLARKEHLVTKFGKILDPISDKLLYGWIIYGVLIKNQQIFWLWFLSIGIIFYIIGYYLFVKKKQKIKPIGKAAIVVETIIVVLFMIDFFNQWLLIIFTAAAFTPVIYYIYKMVIK